MERYLVRAVLAIFFTQVAHQGSVAALLKAGELGDVRRVYRASRLLTWLLRQRYASMFAQRSGRVRGGVARLAEMRGAYRAVQHCRMRFVLVARLIGPQSLALQHQRLLAIGLLQPLEQLDERKVLLQAVDAVVAYASGLPVERA